MLAYQGGNPLISFLDVTEYLSLAEKGSTLSQKALLQIASARRSACPGPRKIQEAGQRLCVIVLSASAFASLA